MIVIFVNASGQRVLDRDHGAGGAPFLERAEEIFETLAGQNIHVMSQELARGLFAEGAALALEGNRLMRLLHRDAPSQRRASAEGSPMRSSTRSMLWSTMSITV